LLKISFDLATSKANALKLNGFGQHKFFCPKLTHCFTGWPDGYFWGHFWQMWLFLGAVFYKKNFFWLYFDFVAILWLF